MYLKFEPAYKAATDLFATFGPINENEQVKSAFDELNTIFTNYNANKPTDVSKIEELKKKIYAEGKF